MKTFILLAPALAILAGCANHEHYASYSDTVTSPYYGSASMGGSDVVYEQRTDNDIVRVQPSTPVIVGATTEPSPETARPYITTPIGKGVETITYDANGISYDTAAPARDAELTKHVQQALYADPTIVAIAPSIHVSCEAGKVILSGKVRDDRERLAIEQRARATTGVVAITDQIQVAYPATGRVGEPHIYSNATDHVIYGRNGVDVVVPSATGRANVAVTPGQTVSTGVSAGTDVPQQQAAAGAAEAAADQTASLNATVSSAKSTDASAQADSSLQANGLAQPAGRVDSQTHTLQNRDLKATSDSTASRNYEQSGSASATAQSGRDSQNPNPQERKDLQTDATGRAASAGSTGPGVAATATPAPQSETAPATPSAAAAGSSGSSSQGASASPSGSQSTSIDASSQSGTTTAQPESKDASSGGSASSAGGSAAVPAKDFSAGARTGAGSSGQDQSSAAAQTGSIPSPQTSPSSSSQSAAQSPGVASAGASTTPASQSSASVSGSTSAGASAAGESTADVKTESGKGSTTDRPQSSLSGLSTGTSASDSAAASVTIQAATDSDHAAGDQITQQLKTDSQLASALPTVRISIVNGKATLTGSVKTQAQKQQIQSKVQQVTGISSVENNLRVGASATPGAPGQ